ncbi:calcium-channel protein Cch1p [Monosporozyma unispora]
MNDNTRELTGPFEPKSLSHEATGNSSRSRLRIPPPTIPSLQISPPKADKEDEIVSNEDSPDNSPTQSGSQMAQLFKNHFANTSTKKLPKLSLKTGASNEIINKDPNVSPNLAPVTPSHGPALSPLSPISHISSKLRRPRENSNRSGSRSRSRSRSVSSRETRNTNVPPRSAKVLSFIAADDMDEFEDIERGFRTAIDDKGFGWLPQIKVENSDDEDQEVPENPFDDFNRMNDKTAINASENVIDQISYLPNESIKVGPSSDHWEGSLFPDKSDVKTKTESEDIPTTQTIDLSTESLNGMVPDFDKPLTNVRKPLRLYGNSLNFLPPTSPFRLKLATLNQHPITQRLYILLLVFFTGLLSYRTYEPTNFSFLYRFNNWTDYLIFIIFIIFTVYDCTKILAFGFWDDSEMFAAIGKDYIPILERCGVVRLYGFLVGKYGAELINMLLPFKIKTSEERKKRQEIIRNRYSNPEDPDVNLNDFDTPRAFARSSWNRIDLVSLVCFWIGLFVSIRDIDDKKGVRIFKPLALLRILRLLNTDTGISSILRALKYGIPQLINVGSMLVYFWVFFGILGVQLFQGSFRRQCVWINPDNPNDTYQYDKQFCGGYLDSVTKNPTPYVFNDGSFGTHSKGFLCPANSQCISNANPYNGRISFDNIVNSMEIIFVIMSANTFTDLMYYTMDSDSMAASLFFIVCIFVLTIWMMNLLIAVLVSSYDLAYEKYRKKKLEKHTVESWPTRFIKGYWKYFKVKASLTPLPNWSVRAIYWYSRCEWVFSLFILTDLITRACISDDSGDYFLLKVKKIDRGISIFLLLESILRLCLYSPNLWKFLVKLNYVYDLIIAVITVIISSMAVRGDIGYMYYWLSIFQISRFYRVIMAITFVRKLWTVVLKNGTMIWNLSSFYFFFTFLVAIIMAVYFEGVVPPDDVGDNPFAMYSLPNSFLSLFIIGSTENWTDILYAIQQYSPNIASAFFATVSLIIWFILSNSVVLNIFIALISESLEIDEAEKRPLQIKHYLQKVYPQKIQEYTHASLMQRLRKKFFDKRNVSDTKDFKQFLMRGTAIMNIAHNMDELADEMKHKPKKASEKKHYGVTEYMQRKIDFKKYFDKLKGYSKNPFFKKSEVIFTESTNNEERSYILQLNEFEDEKLAYLRKYPAFNNTYFLFSPKHKFRRFCQKLVPPSVGKRTDGVRFYDDETDMYTQKKFFYRIERDIFVVIYAILTILLVVISCLVTPLYRKQKNVSTWGWPLYIDCAFISMFSVELIVKTVADGFVYTPNAYLRNPWNTIDFIVLISMWVYLITFLKNDGNVSRIFKGLSALRALRCLTISNTARQTFNMVIFQGSRKLFEASMVSFSLLFPFTIWGIGLFRNRLGTCNDSSLGMGSCFNEYTDEVFQWNIIKPRVYSQPYLYFDTFASAFKTLYEIISLEGWVDLLTNLMNSTGDGTVPSAWSSKGSAIFLILFNFLSMVFILNLFVSFIINNYIENNGTAYFTSEEKAWLESKKLLSQAKPKAIPNLFEMSKIRRTIYYAAVEKSNFYYAIFIQVVLYVHIVVLLSLTYRKNDSMTTFSQVYFMISTTIFVIQEFLHIYGEGFHLYTRQTWNNLRFCVVSVAFILSAISFQVSYKYSGFHNVKDIFQLIIFLFVIPQSDMLSELLETAAASLPAIISLTYTWGILFLVYAMALNQIFGLTRLGPNTTNNINFRTVIKTLIVLFRCSFGEGWNYIMDDFTIDDPYCYVDPVTKISDCGSLQYAYILLMTWNILSMYIFLNMFISLIIGNFSYVYRKGSSKSPVDRTEIKKYIDAWCKLDGDGTGELEFSQLPKLMHSFDGTFSFKIWEGPLTVKNLVKNYMQVNPNDPYDVKVDLGGLNKELNTINKAKIIYKRLQYRRFVQEMYYVNGYDGGIRFDNLLETIPLYTVYNPRECLGIDLYVRYLYTLNKVDKYLDNERNVDVLDMIVIKWKYHLRKRNRDYTDPREIGNFNKDLSTVTPTELDSSDGEHNMRDTLPLTTPRMDFGVDRFMWSPTLTRQNESTDNINIPKRFDWTADAEEHEDEKNA